jgi:hypothetical protein
MLKAMAIIVALTTFAAGPISAGEIPAKATLVYSRGGTLPAASIRAEDGRVFALSLKGSDGDYDLSLLRPGHGASARNLLEPKGNWHGPWPFMILADDLVPGGRWIYGRERDIPVRNYPLILHVQLRDFELVDVRLPNGTEGSDFKQLVLTAELRPAK